MDDLMDVVTWAGLGRFVGRTAGLGAVALLLAELAARAGCAPAAWLGRGRARPLARAGLGYLLGLAALGLAWLGCALDGLCVPAVLAGSGALAVAAARAGWGRRPLLWRAWAAARAVPWPGRLAVAAGVLPVLPFLLVPELEVDSEIYHLAWPWQLLVTHKSQVDWTVFAFHIPLLFETAYTLPVSLGDDRLAKWLTFGAFAAASAFAADRALRRGEPHVGWLAPLAGFSVGLVNWLATAVKSDVPAAACLLAGALLQLEGRWAAGAVLLGLSIAGKYVYGVYVVVWLLFVPPPRRRWARVAAALAVPVLPWAAKAWLETGNPVFPFATGLFRTLEWSGSNRIVFLDPVRPLWVPGVGKLSGVPGGWLATLRAEHLFVLLTAACPLLLGRARRASWAFGLGSLVALAGGKLRRYLLPGMWGLAHFAAEEAGRLEGPWRRALLPLLAAALFTRIEGNPDVHRSTWREAWRPLALVWRDELTTRRDAIAALERHYPGRPGRPTRILSVGDARSYRWPCRVLYGGVLGETPLVWRMVHDSPDAERLRRKFRQLGAPAILLNFVSAEWLAARYNPFPWDRRMTRLYVEYAKRHLVVRVPPERSDYANGGYYLFALRPRPLPVPQATLFFLPGTDALFGPSISLENLNRPADAIQVTRELVKAMPEVGHAWNTLGHEYTMLGDAANGFKCLDPFGRLGMLDGLNLGEWGANAIRVGQPRLAERVLAACWRRCPDHRTVVRMNQALLWALDAHDALTHGKLKRAQILIGQATWAMESIGGVETAPPNQRQSRAETLAAVLGIKGEVLMAGGDNLRAADSFRAAYNAAPGARLAGRWKALADQLSPPMFSAR